MSHFFIYYTRRITILFRFDLFPTGSWRAKLRFQPTNNIGEVNVLYARNNRCQQMFQNNDNMKDNGDDNEEVDDDVVLQVIYNDNNFSPTFKVSIRFGNSFDTNRVELTNVTCQGFDSVSRLLLFLSFFLHLHEIVEGLYFYFSLSVYVCVCVCVCVCLSVRLLTKCRSNRYTDFDAVFAK